MKTDEVIWQTWIENLKKDLERNPTFIFGDQLHPLEMTSIADMKVLTKKLRKKMDDINSELSALKEMQNDFLAKVEGGSQSFEPTNNSSRVKQIGHIFLGDFTRLHEELKKEKMRYEKNCMYFGIQTGPCFRGKPGPKPREPIIVLYEILALKIFGKSEGGFKKVNDFFLQSNFKPVDERSHNLFDFVSLNFPNVSSEYIERHLHGTVFRKPYSTEKNSRLQARKKLIINMKKEKAGDSKEIKKSFEEFVSSCSQRVVNPDADLRVLLESWLD